MDELLKNVGKEVFMLTEEKRDYYTALFFEKSELVLSSFKSSIARNINDVELYHGILTKAISIPSEVSNNIDIVVIIKNLGKSNNFHLIQCLDLTFAQSLVSMLVGCPTDDNTPYADLIKEDVSTYGRKNIDQIFILYGYKIELHYTFDKTELDEEIISGSKEIYEEIKSRQ
jgi:hypothetical protein